jgi:hypothetical protein
MFARSTTVITIKASFVPQALTLIELCGLIENDNTAYLLNCKPLLLGIRTAK